jgi:hypothetical protein
MKPRYLTFLSVLIILLPASNSLAAEFFKLPNTKTLYMMGEIEGGDAEKFIGFINSNDIDTLGVAGPGGSLTVALEIAQMIKQRGMTTLTIEERDCASACSLVFMAGVKRKMGLGSRVGVHLPFVQFVGDGAAASSYCASFDDLGDSDDAFGQWLKSQGRNISVPDCIVNTYQLAFGDAFNIYNLIDVAEVDQQVFRDMISTPPSEMTWYNKEDGLKLNLHME